LHAAIQPFVHLLKKLSGARAAVVVIGAKWYSSIAIVVFGDTFERHVAVTRPQLGARTPGKRNSS